MLVEENAQLLNAYVGEASQPHLRRKELGRFGAGTGHHIATQDLEWGGSGQRGGRMHSGACAQTRGSSDLEGWKKL